MKTRPQKAWVDLLPEPQARKVGFYNSACIRKATKVDAKTKDNIETRTFNLALRRKGPLSVFASISMPNGVPTSYGKGTDRVVGIAP